MRSKIIFENVSKKFDNGLKVLDNVSLEILENESMIILGKSGSGKSVTLKLLLGLLKLDHGDILIDGISVLDKKRREEYRSKFSVLFQGCALFDSMKVIDNVMFAAIQRKIPKMKAYETAKEKLVAVGLDSKVLDLYPSSLSGGMQKRVGLARALVVEPEIMLFDEPTSGLDPLTSNTIANLIKDTLVNNSLNKNKCNTTSLTITHDLNVAQKIGTRAAMLNEGKIIWNGPLSELNSVDNEFIQNFVSASLWKK